MRINLGINIAGYVKSESGVGEGVRANIRSIETTEIPFVINNLTWNPHRQLDTSYQTFTQDNPHPINLIQINAEQVDLFLKYVGSGYLENRYNIGFWAWELPTFPAEWQSAFRHFHEIWTYSNYGAEAISASSPIPVIKMMPSISLATPSLDREALGLPKDKFIFLFMFDFCSILERKNPLAAIAAFKKAFSDSDDRVTFILKTANSNLFPQEYSLLKSVLETSPNIKHIDGYLSKAEINALLYSCDCYVSLHRCEGFGLTMAEAMFYGKPVIATAYSSNTEFMNLGNSFLVRYNLTSLTTDLGPYKKGSVWADPDVEHAAYWMHHIFNDYEQAKRVAARGEREIKSLLSPKLRGSKIKDRLEYINNFTYNFTTLSPTKPMVNDSPQLALARQQSWAIAREPRESDLAKPLVSICIPTYNGEEFVREALQSAFAQTYPNLEIIVSDDGSTDRTVEISRSFQIKASREYRIILHQNYGLVKNWNFCVSQANGKYIKFLFQDDFLEPDCIEKMVILAEKDPEIGLVFSPRGILLAEGAESDPLLKKASQSIKNLYATWSVLRPIQSGKDLLADPKCLANPINKIGEPTTVLIPTKVFHEIGYFDPDLSQYVDLDMWLRIMGRYKIGFVNEHLSSLRIHAGQQTWKNFATGESEKDVCRLYEKMLRDSVYSFLSPELKHQVKQKLEFRLARSQENPINLSDLVNQYQNPLTSQAAWLQLCQIRQKLATQWLNLSASDLSAAYAGEMGNTHQLLINSGIKYEPLNPQEKQFLEQLVFQVSQRESAINACLAAMLYCEAYQLPLPYENAVIPQWFFKDYLEFLLASPRYFKEVGEVERYSKYFQEAIAYISQRLLSQTQTELWQYLSAFITCQVNFESLLGTAEDLKNIYNQRAQIIESFLRNSGCKIDDFESSSRITRGDGTKIRLGILRDEMSDSLESFSFLPASQYLDKSRFEVILYYVQIANASLEDYCQSVADQQVKLPEALPAQVEVIRAARLDILLVDTSLTGLSKPSTLLSAHRLAPIQLITAASAPATAGMSHIDYCLVGSLMGTLENLQSQYREKLVAIEGSGICFSEPFPSPEATVRPTRNSWGASEETVVFFSGAKATKIIPELRETWVKAVAAVPNSILVLYPFRQKEEPYPTTQFVKQMRSLFEQFGLDKRRLVAIKALPTRADFRACLKLADIYLGSFPEGDAAELVEALSVGVPTLVREGQTARSRQTAAILRELHIPELIAESENSYIELCRVLGSNAQLRQHYRQHIQQQIASGPLLLDSRAYAAQMGTLLERIWQDPSQVVSRAG